MSSNLASNDPARGASARELLSGNEAIARGAFEAGVTVATGYPGTPSTEILEALAKLGEGIHCEWSPNEKVALEVAVGASLAGARAIVTMKHVGLNVAADPLMTFAYVGAEGGLVVCVADDPGMHSSQNEQDTRHYARFAKIPILEPSDSEEAREFTVRGLAISEEFRTPVILRSTTRVSHSRGLVSLGARRLPDRPIGFVRDPPRYVPIPLWGRAMRRTVEERLGKLRAAAEASPLNRIELRDRSLGIVTSSVAYQYVREVFPEASVLKLGWSYPFPDATIRAFAAQVERLLVVEELDDFLEEHVRALGLTCDGKNVVPAIGELSPTRLRAVKGQLAGARGASQGQELSAAVLPAPEVKPGVDATLLEGLPARPPVLCPGCPHRGIFYALAQFDVIVTGDIGCYSLGVFPPLGRIDTILCMGGGVSMVQGFEKAGEKRRVVGIVGDSTFFHSGITGLLDIVYNGGNGVIVVVDNRTTAMTGHQPNPGSGETLMGRSAPAVSIEQIARACGLERVFTVAPYDLDETVRVFKEALEHKGPSLLVSRAPCPLGEGAPVGPPLAVDRAACVACDACFDLGCPALGRAEDGGAQIAQMSCGGCGLCEKVCPSGAIAKAGGSR